jgi:uncharacterized protein YwqG
MCAGARSCAARTLIIAGRSTTVRSGEPHMAVAISRFRKSIERRAIVLDIGGFRPPADPKTSWFGKVGFGQAGEEWPTTEDKRPMLPLAQINLTELPFRPPRLDDVEFLTVFVDADNLPGTGEPNGSKWCLRAYPTLASLVALTEPEELQKTVKALPMRARIIATDYPVYDDLGDDVPAELEESFEEKFPNAPGFKLGGWPSLVQSEVFWAPGNLHAAEPKFVFQIDSTEKGRWSWGDGGVGYFGRGTAPGRRDEWTIAWQCY